MVVCSADFDGRMQSTQSSYERTGHSAPRTLLFAVRRSSPWPTVTHALCSHGDHERLARRALPIISSVSCSFLWVYR